MAKVKAEKPNESKTPRRRALTPEARENQLISAAMNLAEQQILDGTASSQVITHFLKLGSTREKEERDRLREENKLLKAKTKALERAEETRVAYDQVLKAMLTYSGKADPDEDDEFY